MIAFMLAALLAAPEDPVQWLKHHALVRLKLYCETAAYGGTGTGQPSESLCTLGSGAIISPNSILTAHHVIERSGARITSIQVCRHKDDGGCLTARPVSSIKAASITSVDGTHELVVHDVALLKFDEPLLLNSEIPIWANHLHDAPLKGAVPKEDDEVHVLGAAYFATAQNHVDFDRPFEAENVITRIASFQARVQAKMFATEVWKDALASHEVLRTCEDKVDVSPGYSGGPVVTGAGELIGVVTGFVGEGFYSNPAHRALFAKPGGNLLRCGYSTIISLYPRAWPDQPFGGPPADAVWNDFSSVSAETSRLNKSGAVSFTAAESDFLSRIEGPLIVSLGSSSERLARYYRRVLQTENERRERLRIQLRCYVDHHDESCKAASFVAQQYQAIPAPVYETGDDDNDNVRLALEIIDTLNSLWDAHRRLETLAAGMQALDDTFGLAPSAGTAVWTMPANAVKEASGLLSPGCAINATDVDTTPMESFFEKQIGLGLDDALGKLLQPAMMGSLRDAYQAVEQARLPGIPTLTASLRGAFKGLDRRIEMTTGRFGWPETMRVSIEELPLKCFRDFPALQRLAWSAFARAHLVPMKALSLSDLSTIIKQTSAPDTARLLSMTRSNGALEQLNHIAAQTAQSHLSSARLHAIDLHTDPLLRGVPGDGALDQYLASTYELGLGRHEWEGVLAELDALECDVEGIIAASLGVGIGSCASPSVSAGPSP